MFLYRFLSIILLPFIILFFLYRCVIKKEIFFRVQEKFGLKTTKRPKGDLVWLHGVSVGEVRSVLILVEQYFNRFPDLNILVTSSTVTSAQIVAEEIKKHYSGRVLHQFLPQDNPLSIKLFLKNWQPKVAIFLESEIWPNFLNILKKKSIPVILANARISTSTAKRWVMLKRIGVKPFDNFSKIFVQNLKDIPIFNKICDVESLYYGNLKNEAQPLDFDEVQLQNLQKKIKGRKVFLAASTHQGEESQIIKIHQNLKQKYQDLLTIIVIRHPNRSDQVQSLLKGSNYRVFDKDIALSNDNEILLVDKLGILGLFYKLSDFAFVAGSLSEIGGHNPCEAIKLDCAVIAGQHYFNFQETYDQLQGHNACIISKDVSDLELVVTDIFENKIDLQEIIKNAQDYFSHSSKSANKTIDYSKKFL